MVLPNKHLVGEGHKEQEHFYFRDLWDLDAMEDTAEHVVVEEVEMQAAAEVLVAGLRVGLALCPGVQTWAEDVVVVECWDSFPSGHTEADGDSLQGCNNRPAGEDPQDRVRSQVEHE